MTFRDTLRHASRPDHDRVDAAFSDLDLADRADFAVFCRIHMACFAALARQPDLDHATVALLARAQAALARDLAHLGEDATAPDPRIGHAFDPDAVAYVVAGSRLGSQVLRKRWAQTTDPTLRAANCYFTLPGDGAHWKDVCHALSQISPDGPRAQRIVADTKAIFAMFFAAFQHIRNPVRIGDPV